MPNWKKVAVSGSAASFSSLFVDTSITASIVSSSQFIGNLSGTASYASNGGVTQLLAGANVTLAPTNGLGQVTISSTSGGGGFNTATGSYGSFYDTTTQTNPVGNIPRSMSFNTTDITNGVSISGSTNPYNTYVKTENAGVYDIQFSAQLDKTDSGADEITIWLRKNGINLTDTATTITLTGNNGKAVAAWNWFVNSAANDYYQIIWQSPDTNVRILAEPADGHPGIPSIILTANRVDQFLSNTGSFSGSFNGDFTGSLFGTASQATSASYALTASYALNGGGGAAFPFTGSAVITGSLAVTGSQTITGSLDVAGNITITGSLTAEGATQISGSLGVTGSTVFTGSVSTTGSNSITGSFNIDGTTTLTGSLTIASAAQISGSLNVTGSTTLSGSLSLTGSQSTTGSFNIDGVTTLTGSLSIAAATQISGSLGVTGSTAFSGSVSTTGSNSITGSLDAVGSTTITGSLNITGSYNLIGSNSTTGSVAITGSLSVTGSVDVQGGVTGSLFGTASYAVYALSASYAPGGGSSATASYVDTLNQNVIITGSLTVGLTSVGANENTLTLGPSLAGGEGEGGQLGLNAGNGYTSASFIDNYQDRLRILKGTNSSSTGEVASFNLNTLQVQFPAYNSVSSYPGTSVATLAVDSGGNVITITGGGGGAAFPFTGSAQITGSLGVTGSVTATSIIETSALRFKENIQDLDSADSLYKLRPVTFDWKTTHKQDIGFIAEEVNEVIPVLAELNENGEAEGVKYSKLTALLTKALQIHEQRLESQQQEIEQLKQEIENLKNK
jgi:hypothetical protein